MTAKINDIHIYFTDNKYEYIDLGPGHKKKFGPHQNFVFIIMCYFQFFLFLVVFLINFAMLSTLKMAVVAAETCYNLA